MLESISTQVAWQQKEYLSEDRSFIVKFIFLVVMIVALASYIVFQGVVTVDKLSLPFSTNSFSALKLDAIEKNFNGNAVDLTIMEKDFDGLEGLTLSDIELLDIQEPVSKVASASKKVQKSIIIKSSKKKRGKVFISSQKIGSLSFIKKKFYATNNISFSLLLSKKFMEKRSYNNALKWALISNEIDEKNEESWILFAKAKVELGKKQDAINALSIYLKNNNSIQVKKALEKIKTLG